jgi:hypothetical protein
MTFSSASAVDLMDSAPALPTGPRQQQDQHRIAEAHLDRKVETKSSDLTLSTGEELRNRSAPAEISSNLNQGVAASEAGKLPSHGEEGNLFQLVFNAQKGEEAYPKRLGLSAWGVACLVPLDDHPNWGLLKKDMTPPLVRKRAIYGWSEFIA